MKIEDAAKLIAGVISQAKNDRRDADFYLRILIQAILTHGINGSLGINPSLSDEAKDFVKNGTIEFGDGIVTITKGSLK